MNTPIDAAEAVVFKPRTSKWFAGVTWVLVGIGLAFTVATNGLSGLVSAWPLLALAFFGWWTFWYPSVQVDNSAVTIDNPLRSIEVPWPALINVDTKYALTLVTTRGSFTSWAAPAPGIWGTHRGKPEHVQGLPETTYGPAQSIRPGDLSNTDSGTAAYLVRSRWAALLEAGRVDTDLTESITINKRIHWGHVLVAAALLTATAVAFALA